MTRRALVGRDRLLMEGIAVLYLMAIAETAHRSGWHYLLFPALAALSYDVLTRPWGKWASQPGRLVVTPTLGAAAGTLISREFAYHVVTIVLIVVLCLLLLTALKSTIAPTIAAGLLPLVLDIKSWLFPVAIMLGLASLAAILLPWQTHYRRKYQTASGLSAADIDDLLETPPGGNGWLLPLLLFVTVMACCAVATGLRLILFPPLVVIAYEMFAHPTSCPWAKKPLTLPVACLLTSAGGWLAVSLFGTGAIAAGCGMLIGIIVLQLLKIHMPPALAIALLPLIIVSSGIKYPISVGIGTTALTFAFLLYRKWFVGQGRAGRNVSIS